MNFLLITIRENKIFLTKCITFFLLIGVIVSLVLPHRYDSRISFYTKKSESSTSLNSLDLSQLMLAGSPIASNHEFSILDISNDEGAEYIHDLNDLIFDKSLLNQYDYVIDFGTQEHVFNNNIFLLNVFNLLKDKGNYIFELPANCNLEHCL